MKQRLVFRIARQDWIYQCDPIDEYKRQSVIYIFGGLDIFSEEK